jgi:hypothetical protein
MPWTYDQNSGRFYAPSGVEASSGISGDFLHANYGPSQRLQFAGPIPQGLYNIGHAYTHPVLGPLTMDLPPIGHIAFGRNNFRIHGTKGHHWASAGCIILDPETRRQIAMSGDRVLKVK